MSILPFMIFKSLGRTREYERESDRLSHEIELLKIELEYLSNSDLMTTCSTSDRLRQSLENEKITKDYKSLKWYNEVIKNCKIHSSKI